MRSVRPFEAPFRKRPAKAKSGKACIHESAVKHVTGAACYVDDIPEPPATLHLATGGSIHPHARITRLQLDAVRASAGVVAVFTHADVPGELDVGAVYPGDPLLAPDYVEFVGQPIFLVAALSYEQAQQAVAKAQIEYEVLQPVLEVAEALESEFFVLPTHTIERGQPDSSLQDSAHLLTSECYIRGQEHLYLEGQVCLVIPTEDGGMHVQISSQHPTEVQKLVAEVLDIPVHLVSAEVRRMGGGFGGKESQAAALACMAAMVAHFTGSPAKFRLPRRQDMEATGKRHDFHSRTEVGFDDRGVIEAIDMTLSGKCGYSPDLSQGIVDRAMFHGDNAYYLANAKITGNCCKTHTVSNTAFRGFGGPQGMLAMENVIERIARHLGQDPLVIRQQNLYRPGYDVTPYGQKIEQHTLPELMSQLEKSSDYWQRRKAIREFNSGSRLQKKGLALTPVKFGISFTASHLNQAGALLHIYTDGSILLNHGGTEMGQGLFTKIQQLVATEFGVAVERVQVSSTRTDKVPNSSPTAASSGTDLNGMAALDAAKTLKARLCEFVCRHFSVQADAVRFEDNQVFVAEQAYRFAEITRLAYMDRVQLSATGFYKTPKVYYDREKAQGHPFFYFANGAAAAEVLVDTLTGEYRVTRVDILHDVGRSINPAIDIGQIEGGFIQGMGWLTTEELLWNDRGQVVSNGPANYKIPTAFDVPPVFNVAIHEGANDEDTVFNSKAVGEPPLMLAISVWAALQDACASVANYETSPLMDTPATPERVLAAITAAGEHLAHKSCASAVQKTDRG